MPQTFARRALRYAVGLGPLVAIALAVIDGVKWR
jgi:hypothetical protein